MAKGYLDDFIHGRSSPSRGTWIEIMIYKVLCARDKVVPLTGDVD